MKRLIVTALSATLVLAGCGGSSGGNDQRATADLVIELAGEQGLELDADCVRETADKLSDDDAKAIVDAGVDGTPDISDEGNALSNEIFQCVDADSYIESLVTSISEDGTTDADCLRSELEGLTVDEAEDRVIDAALGCALD